MVARTMKSVTAMGFLLLRLGVPELRAQAEARRGEHEEVSHG
jgi:hypothetical protein